MLERIHQTFLHLNLSSPIAKFALLILVVLALAFLIDFFLSHSVFGKAYRIFVAPGIIIHELAHAFMCLLTGAKMSKISFFEKDGGKVEHTASKIPILGALLISLAPFAAGAVMIYFLSRKLGLLQVDVHAVEATRAGIINFFTSEIKSINYHSPVNIVIIYLVLTTAVTMTPSFQDFRNIVGSLAFVGVALYLVDRFTKYGFSYFVIPNQITTLLSTVIFLLILGLALSIVVFVISKLFIRTGV